VPFGSILNNEIDFVSNNAQKFITWNGLNFDIYTLDLYYNYEKYFEADMEGRINNKNETKHALAALSLKLLKLFDTSSSILLLSTRINRFQAIIRNIIDFFTLSAIRFVVTYEHIPESVAHNLSLIIKVIFNLCVHLNKKIGFYLKSVICEHYCDSFSLFKYICLYVYVRILKYSGEKRHVKLTKILEKILTSFFFVNTMREQENAMQSQIDFVINQQLEKFQKCMFKNNAAKF